MGHDFLQTDFLYARSGFLTGMASAIDLGGTLSKEYNNAATPSQADFYAILSDWKMTGLDLLTAINSFKDANVKQGS